MSGNIIKPYQQSNVPKEPFVFYIGIDCTSNTLHVGHLYLLFACQQLVNKGNKCFVLLGTQTASIGDPTGRTDKRKEISGEVVDQNYYAIWQQIDNIGLDCTIVMQHWNYPLDAGNDISMHWLLSLNLFKDKLDNNLPLSFGEIKYPVMQGFDFVMLNKLHNVTVQVGGQDQWANMSAGLKMNNKLGIATYPLLTNKKGEKISKTTSKNLFTVNSTDKELFDFYRSISDEKAAELFGKMDSVVEINAVKAEFAGDMVRFIRGSR